MMSADENSHASKTAKITVLDPVMCKTPDAPLQDELLLKYTLITGENN